MSDGYNQFFKQAKKASAQGSPVQPGKRADKTKPIQPKRSPNAQKPSFRLNPEREGGQVREATPEETLRQALASRMATKKRASARRRRKFPFASAIVVVLALVVAGLGYYRPDAFDAVFSHLDIGAFGQAQAKEDTPDSKAEAKKNETKGAAKLASNTSASKEKSADGAGSPAATDGEKKDEQGPNVKGWSPEELSFFNKLNDRKKELDLREGELNKLEEELHQQKLALEEKIKELEKMRSEISTTLKTRVTTDQAKVDKLVDFYSTMKPQQAAKIIESLNEDLAVEVIDKMKKKNAAEIMNMMHAKKARRLSELLTGYERVPSSTEAEATSH